MAKNGWVTVGITPFIPGRGPTLYDSKIANGFLCMWERGGKQSQPNLWSAPVTICIDAYSIHMHGYMI